MFYKNKHITQPLIIFKQQYQVHWGVGLNIPNSKCMGVTSFFFFHTHLHEIRGEFLSLF